MKNTHSPNPNPKRRLCALLISLSQCLSGTLSPAKAADAPAWVNISEELTKKLDAMEYMGKNGKPWTWMRRSQGLALDPRDGRVFLYFTAHDPGMFVSKDHGATWEKAGDNAITGRAEMTGSFSQPWPADGRMAVFTIDGVGGLTLDGGAHWSRVEKHRRAFDFGDVDWSSPQPKLIFAANHEPFGRCVSTDAGATWTQLDNYTGNNEANKKGRGFRLGVFDSQTLLSAHLDEDGIFTSTDLGKTWTKVANYRVIAHHPVHYGKRLYWATTEGIITTDNGRDWKLHGTPLKDASAGPYFGKTESDMMVVTPDGYFITHDAAKSWQKVTDYFVAPDMAGGASGYHINGSWRHFAWDPVNNLLYTSGNSGGAYRLKLN